LRFSPNSINRKNTQEIRILNCLIVCSSLRSLRQLFWLNAERWRLSADIYIL
jgi:hypothetical protein